MQDNSSRRRFIAGAAAAAAALMGKFGSLLGREIDGPAAPGHGAIQTVADTSPVGVATTRCTYDRHARLLAVTYPGDAVATTFAYPDA